jgi:hypothetical protein
MPDAASNGPGSDIMVSREPANTGQGSTGGPGGGTVLAPPLADRLVIFIGIPGLAVLLGLLLPPFARWLLGLSHGLPVRPVFRFIGAADRPWEIAINLVIWLLVGLAVARSAASDSTKVTVGDADVRLDQDNRLDQDKRTRTVRRADAVAVFLDGKKLVILDHESRQLVRDPVQLSGAVVARAFKDHGYPWQDADPYADLYRRWVADSPELPTAANAVLAARETALKKKARRDVRDLQEAVEKLGYAVREEGSRQYWRPLVRS